MGGDWRWINFYSVARGVIDDFQYLQQQMTLAYSTRGTYKCMSVTYFFINNRNRPFILSYTNTTYTMSRPIQGMSRLILCHDKYKICHDLYYVTAYTKIYTVTTYMYTLSWPILCHDTVTRPIHVMTHTMFMPKLYTSACL